MRTNLRPAKERGNGFFKRSLAQPVGGRREKAAKESALPLHPWLKSFFNRPGNSRDAFP